MCHLTTWFTTHDIMLYILWVAPTSPNTGHENLYNSVQPTKSAIQHPSNWPLLCCCYWPCAVFAPEWGPSLANYSVAPHKICNTASLKLAITVLLLLTMCSICTGMRSFLSKVQCCLTDPFCHHYIKISRVYVSPLYLLRHWQDIWTQCSPEMPFYKAGYASEWGYKTDLCRLTEGGKTSEGDLHLKRELLCTTLH